MVRASRVATPAPSRIPAKGAPAALAEPLLDTVACESARVGCTSAAGSTRIPSRALSRTVLAAMLTLAGCWARTRTPSSRFSRMSELPTINVPRTTWTPRRLARSSESLTRVSPPVVSTRRAASPMLRTTVRETSMSQAPRARMPFTMVGTEPPGEAPSRTILRTEAGELGQAASEGKVATSSVDVSPVDVRRFRIVNPETPADAWRRTAVADAAVRWMT
jgi:hypothetical protein